MLSPYMYHLSRAIETAPSIELRNLILSFMKGCQEKVITISGGGPVVRLQAVDGKVLRFKAIDRVPQGVFRSLQEHLSRDITDLLMSLKARGESVTILLC